MPAIEVGWEKVARWSKKSGNISETRKDRGKVTMDNGGPIGTHQRSFERYHLRPPTSSSSPRLGARVDNPTQNFNRKYQELVKLYRLQIWPEHSQQIHNKCSLKSLENYCPQCPSKHEKFPRQGSMGVSIPGTAQSFWVPPIISGTGKATNFKFGPTEWAKKLHTDFIAITLSILSINFLNFWHIIHYRKFATG